MNYERNTDIMRRRRKAMIDSGKSYLVVGYHVGNGQNSNDLNCWLGLVRLNTLLRPCEPSIALLVINGAF